MEIAFLESLSAIRCGFLDAVMLFFSYIAEMGAVCVLAAIVLLFFKKTRKGGIILAAALAADVLIVNVVLKHAVARPRPFVFSEALTERINSMGYKLPEDYSFPSGHAAVTFCAAGALLRLYKKYGVPALIVAVLTAFSRLYIGVHYPTDVLAGALIGLGIGLLAAESGLRAAKRFAARKSAAKPNDEAVAPLAGAEPEKPNDEADGDDGENNEK